MPEHWREYDLYRISQHYPDFESNLDAENLVELHDGAEKSVKIYSGFEETASD